MKKKTKHGNEEANSFFYGSLGKYERRNYPGLVCMAVNLQIFGNRKNCEDINLGKSIKLFNYH